MIKTRVQQVAHPTLANSIRPNGVSHFLIIGGTYEYDIIFHRLCYWIYIRIFTQYFDV